MSQYQDTIWCDGCGIEIVWVPLQNNNSHFCCQDCKEGFRCQCREREEQESDRDRVLAAQQTGFSG